jgi:hypothetical protein
MIGSDIFMALYMSFKALPELVYDHISPTHGNNTCLYSDMEDKQK